jgi:hypothetical protein
MNLKNQLAQLREKLIQKKQSSVVTSTTNSKKDVSVLGPKENEDVIKLLERSTVEFFPKDGIWSSFCFGKHNELQMINLPCHLRDTEWLARMLQKKQNLGVFNINNIIEFVKTSSFFAEQLHNYEQEIVRWQISWMTHGGENWLADEKYGGDEIMSSPKCDIGFRKGVIDTLSAIGMDKEAIEEGIERNADSWRENHMKRAFSNEFYDFFYDLDPVEQGHEELWLKMRRYEYYRSHKKSVDKYGIATPDMQMSDEEVSQLRISLAKLNLDRKNHIRECKKNPSKRRVFRLY